jgi:hypothetical protein
MADYIRDLRPAKWASGVSLHSSNPKPPLSALGQKQTLQSVRTTSALCQEQTYAVQQKSVPSRDENATSHLQPPETQQSASYRLKLAHWKMPSVAQAQPALCAVHWRTETNVCLE